MTELFTADLAHEPLWVGWRAEIRGGQRTKIPYDPITGRLAQSDNKSTWASRGEAETWALKSRADGIGLMFSPIQSGLHLAGVDLDTCRETAAGHLTPWAEEVIGRFQTYAEVSPSQSGVKLFFTYAQRNQAEIATLFDGKNGRAFNMPGSEHPPGIEIYIAKRYFAVTDDEVGDFPALRQVSVEDLRWLVTEAGPKLAGNGKMIIRGPQKPSTKCAT